MQQFKLPFLILSLTLSATVFAQPTAISVQKGQKYNVESTTKSTSSAEVMGQTMENNMDSKSTIVYEVINTTSTGIDLQSTITKMVVSATMMGQEATYDSDKTDNAGPLADILGKTVNKGKGVTIDAKGTITKQDESDSEGGMGGMSPAATFSTELFIPALIGKELKAGDSFTDVSNNTKDKYNSRDSGTYTITAIENGVASISYVGTQVVNAVMEQMGMEMTSNSNNTVKTEMQVDAKTGMVLAKATVVESTVSIDAAGMTIPATGKTITTIKISPAR